MSRNKLILLFGILLFMMPFLGFPSGWKTVFYVLVGFILIIMAVVGHVQRRSPLMEDSRHVVTEVYVETHGSQ